MRKMKTRIMVAVLALTVAVPLARLTPEAMTYNKIVEITKDGQVVDSYRGVDAVYRKNAYETELPWNCAGYVRAFYQKIYGVNVTNLFHGQIPNGNKDGGAVEFVQVKAPKEGDICGEVKESTNHWTIVRKVMGDAIVVIEQNYKWMEDDKVYCQINRKVNYKDGDYRFYRLASRTKESERVIAKGNTSGSAKETEKKTEKTTQKKTTVKPTEKTTQKTTTAKPTEKKTEKTTAKPAEKTTQKKTTAKPTEKTTQKKTTAKPTEKTTQKTTTAKPTEKKTEKTTAKPAEKTTQKKTTAKPTEKKTEKTTAKPAKKTSQKKTDCKSHTEPDVRIVSNITEISINPKATFDLAVTYEGTQNKPETVTYSSSDKDVASVDRQGKVTAKKPGVTTITMSADGAKASCVINVKGEPQAEKLSGQQKTADKETVKNTEKKTEKTTTKKITTKKATTKKKK